MTTLMEAHRQWKSRPADERYSSVADMHAAATGSKELARRSQIPTSKLRVEAHAGDVYLIGAKDQIELTNWSFGQLSTAADAPASYLRRLPAHMAADCINHGIRQSITDKDRDRDNLMLFKKEHSGMVTLRALTSTKYTRIWNADITSRLVELEAGSDWQPAPAAAGGSRGLYLGDRDMFAFMVDNNRRVYEKAPGGGLSRGFFVVNSETGAASFSIKSFFYSHICENHMVWGSSNIKEVKIRHVGNADGIATEELHAELTAYADSSAKEDELKIEKMRTYVIGKDLDAILDKVMGLKIGGLNKKTVTAGYELAQQREDWYGAPNTMWGLAGGLTEIARDLPNADDRLSLETTTGKLMEIAF